MEPGGVGMTLLIFPVYEEEAMSSQCVGCPSKEDQRKTILPREP